tara:strand:- start:308 stop:1795 length:1488 start_codon:yes stop_codon:yes gene_type:complete
MIHCKSIIKFFNIHEYDAWVCGGTARDVYLKKEISSYDIVVSASFSELKTLLKDKIISMDKVNATLIIRYKDQEFYISPFKKIVLDRTYPSWKFTTDITEDAQSRDFTINALYYNPITNKWVDPCNAKKDLDNKLIKFIGDWKTKVLESKIRLLRASVLLGVLGEGWSIDYDTEEAIKSYKLKLVPLSAKVMYKEIIKIFTRCKKPSVVFDSWRNTGILSEIFPELGHCINIDQSQKKDKLDLYQHIMYALDSVPLSQPNHLIIRLAALMHDIGKPQTQTIIEGDRHFYNHENVGKTLSTRILSRWGFSKKIKDKVGLLVENHLFNLTASSKPISLRRFITRVGPDNVQDLLDLRIADRHGCGRKISMWKVETLRKKLNTYLSDISPENFHLDLSDTELEDILRKSTEPNVLPEAVAEAKKYLISKITIGRVKNKKPNLRKVLNFILKIKCPLDTPHLFKTWYDLNTGQGDMFDNGTLKCGIYCGFNCDKILEKK